MAKQKNLYRDHHFNQIKTGWNVVFSIILCLISLHVRDGDVPRLLELVRAVNARRFKEVHVQAWITSSSFSA